MLEGEEMNTITEELVTIDINGRTVDCYVWGYYHPAYDGGYDEPGEPEMYELTELFTRFKDEKDQQAITDMLVFDFVREDIIKQLKENE